MYSANKTFSNNIKVNGIATLTVTFDLHFDRLLSCYKINYIL